MMDKSFRRQLAVRAAANFKRSVIALSAGVALQAGLLMPAGSALALESSTIVVGDGDTISALFRQARIPQAQLMSLLHSSKQAEKKLDRVRPGAIISVAMDASGRLQRLQITSKRGKLTTFVREGKRAWQIIDGKVAATAKPSAPKADATKPTVRVEQASAAPKLSPRKVPIARTRIIKSAPRVALRHEVSQPTPKAILKAEAMVRAARMVVEASAPIELNYDLTGMPAKIYAAEQRAQRARARQHLLSFGPKNTRAVMRVAKSRVKVRGEGPKVGKVLASARNLLGSPYLWGGTTPSGFDCSGFVVYNLNKVDVRVPRTAHQQFNYTRNSAVAWNDLQPGDLVFFHDRLNRRRIGHVGIFIGDGKFIHAVKKGIPVKITSINRAYYRKRFVRGGRVIS